MRMSLLWLVILAPAVVATALGAVPPISHLTPLLTVLALVAWAQWANSPLAIRTRTNLRLALIPGVLMLGVSASGVLLSAPIAPALDAMLRTILPMLSLVLPAATLVAFLAGERDAGTFEALLASPIGRVALLEKWGLGAVLLGASFSLLTRFVTGDDLQWLALAGYALPFTSVMSCFLLVRSRGAALGLTLIAPLAPALTLTVLRVPGEQSVIVGYSLLMLALLPRLLRRGVSAPTLDEMLPTLPTRGHKRLSPFWSAELTSQRDALICAFIGWVAFGALWWEHSENATPVLWLVCTFSAALSPVLAFAEAQREGTLEWLLTVRPRQHVFTSKVLLSAGLTVVGCIALPLGLQLLAHTTTHSGAWLLSMFFAWSVSLAVSMYVRGAGAGLGIAMVAIAALFMTLMAAFVAAAMAWRGFSDGRIVGIAVAITALSAIAHAWWRFVRVPLAPVRGLALTLLACVVTTSALSALGH